MFITYLYLCIAIMAEVIATSSLKSSEGFSRFWPSLICIVGYGLAVFLLSLTLRTLPTGIAYAIWSGIGIVLVSAIGWVYYGQKLDTPAIIGLSLIIAGVIVVNVFSKSIAH
ncbi:SMR family transporter [Ewingella americana]|uniref:QacE family quaternary ammonium compound efflux SMR transporter n=1 Tax=Ewingella americana TaxID=41202 RepID=A0A502GBG2_9GAMM|nr:QacE family quaternary ammonium compound efflux SMR transporter [Ewingella americana]